MSQRREEEEDNNAEALWLCCVVRWRSGASCTKPVVRLQFGLIEYQHFEKWPSFCRLLIYFLPGEICWRPDAFFASLSSCSLHSGSASLPTAAFLLFFVQAFLLPFPDWVKGQKELAIIEFTMKFSYNYTK